MRKEPAGPRSRPPQVDIPIGVKATIDLPLLTPDADVTTGGGDDACTLSCDDVRAAHHKTSAACATQWAPACRAVPALGATPGAADDRYMRLEVAAGAVYARSRTHAAASMNTSSPLTARGAGPPRARAHQRCRSSSQSTLAAMLCRRPPTVS